MHVNETVRRSVNNENRNKFLFPIPFSFID